MSVKDEKKLFAARFMQNLCMHLPRAEPTFDVPELPKKGVWVGNLMQADRVTSIPLFFPLGDKPTYISGRTRFGKSTLKRLIVEHARIERIPTLIMESTIQTLGLLIPNDDPRCLARFDKLGIGREYVRGFSNDVKIYCPGLDIGSGLPENPKGLFDGCSVISFKGMRDVERCKLAAHILEATYYSPAKESRGKIRFLIVLEEAHALLPGNVVDKEAKKYAGEVQTYVTRIIRELGKFGVVIVIVTQLLSDFRGPVAMAVREMVDNHFFFRAADPTESEYIQNCASKEAVEIIKNLRVGEAFLHNSDIPGVKFFVRPPLSAVREPIDDEIREISRRLQRTPPDDGIRRTREPELSEMETQAHALIRRHYEKFHEPILLTELDRKMKIQGGTRQRLVNTMEQKGLVQRVTVRKERGRPAHGIVPVLE